MPIVKGLAELLPARIYNPIRSAPLRVLTVSNPVPDSDKLLLKVGATIAAGVKAAGKSTLADLGQLRLSRPQGWVGGHMLAPTIPARTALASIAGVRMVVPSSPTPVVSVNDCLVIGDEIVFDSDLAAVINVRGVVIFAANKITVRPGARVTWSPVDFNPQTFDHPGDGANGKAGFPGHGSTWSNSPHPASKQGGKGEDGHPGSNGNTSPDAPSVVQRAAAGQRSPRGRASGAVVLDSDEIRQVVEAHATSARAIENPAAPRIGMLRGRWHRGTESHRADRWCSSSARTGRCRT